MTDTKHGLGRGLDALFGDDSQEFDLVKFVEDTPDSNSKGVEYMSVESIMPCEYQPRKTFNDESLKDLTESIRQKGVLQPILVRKKGGAYEIIAGERRFRAAIDAGLNTVPVIRKDLSDAEAFEVALIENMMRENLSPIEEAKGFQKLTQEYQYTHEKLSQSVGKSRSYITNAIRLLDLPMDVQTLVNDKKISAGHARALIGCENAEELAQKVIEKDLSVRQTEDLISRLKNGKKDKTPILKDDDVVRLEQELEVRLNVKTEVSFNQKGKGKIVLKYNNFKELEDLLNKLEK
ncbi:MAG: ParB/RepB/Spo0J family partition protein [Alphaproteobacteria bacterium]|nr:ParB/RepB/Spo0J family partition protein [Alphaproteobacteria bacterium]